MSNTRNNIFARKNAFGCTSIHYFCQSQGPNATQVIKFVVDLALANGSWTMEDGDYE